MLARESDFDSVGQSMFKQLVRDLQMLETDGLIIGDVTFKVILAAIAGDNLGSHCIGGFVKNFSGSGHICRFCLATMSDLNDADVIVTPDRIRTPQSYDAAVTRLKNSDADSVDGIKFESIFNQLKFYHVCQPGLPPCIAHDLFEGVVAYDVPLFLKHLITQKYTTLESINAIIESICLSGSDAKVRPPALHKKLDHLTGSASQNWFFLRIVPILLFGCVDVSDEVYQTLLLLREVVEHVMAPCISRGQVAYMDVIIKDYLQHRKDLFPDVKLRPKHHYMLHYASLTLKFGPLVRIWTMRFENKHQYFKKCVRNSRNFVNLTGMLASRHQLLQAYLSASPRFPTNPLNIQINTTVGLSHVSPTLFDCIVSQGLRSAQLCTEVMIKGTLYSKGCVLPLEVGLANKVTSFGKIEILALAVDTSVAAVVTVHEAQFEHNIGCYVLERDSLMLKCVPFDCFLDYYPLYVHTVSDRDLVVLKHQLVDRH